MVYQRLGGNWFKKKTRSKKSRDTVPLKGEKMSTARLSVPTADQCCQLLADLSGQFEGIFGPLVFFLFWRHLCFRNKAIFVYVNMEKYNISWTCIELERKGAGKQTFQKFGPCYYFCTNQNSNLSGHFWVTRPKISASWQHCIYSYTYICKRAEPVFVDL